MRERAVSSTKTRYWIAGLLVLTTEVGAVGCGAKPQSHRSGPAAGRRVTQAERQAAAARAAAVGLVPRTRALVETAGALSQPQMGAHEMMPGAVPHYFGPYPNYANSPLRMVDALITLQGGAGAGAAVTAAVDPTTGAITTIDVIAPGFGYTAPVTVTISSALGGGAGAEATATLTGGVSAVTIQAGGAGYSATPLVELAGGGGSGASATAVVDAATGAITSVNVINGGAGYTSAPTVTFIDATGTGASAAATISGGIAAVQVTNGGSGYITPGIRKFVDGLPGLTAAKANNLGQYIPVAAPDTTTYPGADYYEVAVVQYQKTMHSDLPPTTLRGYVQLSTAAVPGAQVPLTYPSGAPILVDGQQARAVEAPQYLGPLIAASKNRPVRILFRNLLPTGQEGDLFLPVDTTVMGSGMGPEMGGMSDPDPQRPMCGMRPKPAACFTENRATLHLHGGISPWISDGTPHQWVTPAGEQMYPAGVSVKNVPDMPDPGPGAITFFYTNQQSARLMFYHDHAWGITRLNVYAGEAAPYVITDPMESALVTQGVLPAEQIPLVIQDKTFVPYLHQLAAADPTWDVARWGGHGNLWLPHVYMPAQNPGDSSGVNQFGRWAYGPWFWPPTLNIDHPPMSNPYFDASCDPDVTWCEPPLMPGTPYLSMGMESFHDTPVVNGTAYPTVTVEPKAYRLRVLNAANDRFWNLQLYRADATGKDVAMVPAVLTPSYPPLWPTDGREGGVPDPATRGPSWVQIGTEGGFLPAPVVVPNQPVTWVADPTVFNAGNVQDHSLLLGPAERADVIVDFSAYAGQTLILYNDAPAAFPALDPRYDYYTGNPDLRDTGGAPPTPPGYGPNTRTIMQIQVAAGPVAPAFDVPALETAFKATSLGGQGVFATSQHPIIVGQGAYNSAYGTQFKINGPRAGLAQIFDTSLSFDTLSGVPLVIPLQPKAIQDEMGEAFEKEYGRMSGNLGLEVPQAQAGLQQNLVPYPYVNPATEILKGVVNAAPIATADDGTQIWKITHNGVDTHPIHFHLFDVQLINRVGWDGIIRRPDANELGWKDTVRVSPLEDTIVALRPILPKSPFGLPDSVRPLNPMMPLGSTAMFTNTDPNGNPITPPITNQVVNFGWEYVWHCHILSHEEMDMMRPISVQAERQLPEAPLVTIARSGAPVALAWTDGTPVNYQDLTTWGSPAAEVGYRIARAPLDSSGTPGAYAVVAGARANATSYTDETALATRGYSYRVIAYNAAGEAPSTEVAVASFLNVPGAPQSVTAVAGNAQAVVSFGAPASDGGSPILLYEVISAPDGVRATGPSSPITVTGLQNGTPYTFTVVAINEVGAGPASAPSNTVVPTAPNPPAAPTRVTARASALSAAPPRVTVTWSDNSNNEAGFRITRSTTPGFTGPLVTTDVGPNVTTFVDSSVAPNTRYWYFVSAFNASGSSPRAPNNTDTVRTSGQLPAAPSLTVAGVTASSITLTWTIGSPPPVTSFDIQRRRPQVGNWNTIATGVPGTTTSYTDEGLPANRTRLYRVRARNADGIGAWSNVVTATTAP